MSILGGIIIGIVTFIGLVALGPTQTTPFSIDPNDSENYVNQQTNKYRKPKSTLQSWID